MDTPPDSDERQSGEDLDWQTRSALRVTLLEALTAEPHNLEALCSRTTASRATCEAVLDDAETNNWVSYDGVRYRVTPVGKLIAVHLTALLEFSETISEDRTRIEAHADRLRSLAVAISELERSDSNRTSRLASIEDQLNEKAENRDIDDLQERIDAHSEQASTTRNSIDELSQRIDGITKRLGDVEERVQSTQRTVRKVENRNEELRAELEEVRTVAERTTDHAGRGWIDRLSGK